MSPLRDLLRSPAVLAALFLGVALRVILAIVTPVGGVSQAGRLSSYNDEIAHIHYVHHVLTRGQLPEAIESIQAEGALERGHFENYQPPLYYVAAASICFLTGQRDLTAIALIGRLTALACSLISLWILLCITAALSLEPAQVAAAAIFWALNGVMIRFGSTTGNDPLLWICAGGMILTALRFARPQAGPWNGLAFAAFAVAGLYTKLSSLILLPLLFFAWICRRPRASVAPTVALTVLILVAAGPLWWRNVHSFESLLPLSAGFGEPHWRIPGFPSLAYAVRSFFFPWPELWRGAIGLVLMAPVMLITCAAAVSPACRSILRREPVLLWALILSFVAYLGLNLQYDQAEARYLFAAWPALALWLSMPLRTEPARWLLVVAFLLPYSLML